MKSYSLDLRERIIRASEEDDSDISNARRFAECRVMYLPPYSPDYPPIGPVWSWLKHQVRRL